MQNNTNKNQQLLKDRLFLEKVFLLDIELDRKTNTTDLIPILEPQSLQSDRSNDVRLSDVDLVSTPVPQRTIAPISLVSIYAVVVTLLLLLPSNREGANGKTVIEDAERENERISLLETKIQQLEAKTQILASEVNVDSQHGSSPLIETAEPVSLPVHLTATKLEAIDLESGRGVDNTAQLPTDIDRLPPLPETASSPVVIQTPIQSAIADTVGTAVIPIDRLSPLPVPEPPSFPTQTPLLLPLPPTSVRTMTAINTADLNSPVEPEVEPKLEIKSEIIVPETTVEEEIDKPAEQWLGQTDVVYYSFSFQENSTPENLAEAEASLPDDEDLKQYLTAVKSRSHRLLRRKTTEPAVTVGKVQAGEQPTSSLLSTEQPLTSDRILDSDSQPIAEPTQLVLDVKNNESLAEPKSLGSSSEEDLEQYLDSNPLFDNESELPSTAFDSEKLPLPTLFDDEDLARYLDSAPLLDDELVRQILGTSTSTERNEAAISEEAEADKNPKSTEQPSEEKIIRRSLAIEVERESQARQSLFADEDLRQFLTYTPLFSDSVLKEKLK